MDVLLTGGTGFIGTHLGGELLERGHSVTALARDPGAATTPEGIETVRGDVTDLDSLEAAADGKDALVQLVAVSPLRKPRGGNAMHDRVHRQGTANAVEAAEAAGIDRFVQLSAIKADPDGPTAYLRAKGRAEEHVRASDLDWVIVRPTVVFGDGGEFLGFVRRVAPPYLTPLPGGGSTRFQAIWVGDFVPVVADALESADHVGETYEIGGADRYTLAEIAAMVHEANGRPTTVVPIPMALAGLGMGIGEHVPYFPFGRDQFVSLKMDLVTDDNDLGAFGLAEDDLRGLRDYLGLE